ncbi:MAG: hypothetical protein JWQ96_1783 [Segetibacter sp.]|nr:hypothetical protein [Segetibacter sp.]
MPGWVDVSQSSSPLFTPCATLGGAGFSIGGLVFLGAYTVSLTMLKFQSHLLLLLSRSYQVHEGKELLGQVDKKRYLLLVL